MIKRIVTIFIICTVCLSLRVDFAYAKEEYVFHSLPEGYPKSVQEGIKLANEYISKKLLYYDMENLFFPEWMRYNVIENNKEVSGKAYLNNLINFRT